MFGAWQDNLESLVKCVCVFWSKKSKKSSPHTQISSPYWKRGLHSLLARIAHTHSHHPGPTRRKIAKEKKGACFRFTTPHISSLKKKRKRNKSTKSEERIWQTDFEYDDCLARINKSKKLSTPDKKSKKKSETQENAKLKCMVMRSKFDMMQRVSISFIKSAMYWQIQQMEFYTTCIVKVTIFTVCWR